MGYVPPGLKCSSFCLLPPGMFLGIVTEFVLRLHPVPSHLPCITAIFPLDMAEEVSRAGQGQ